MQKETEQLRTGVKRPKKCHKRKTKKRKEKNKVQREITWPEAVTTGINVKQVVFHTVNHHGPLPLRELHSTGETIGWRDPGGS